LFDQRKIDLISSGAILAYGKRRVHILLVALICDRWRLINSQNLFQELIR